MLEFLIGVWRVRRSFKNARAAREALVATKDSIMRNGMAYAWEIGRGAPFVATLNASPDNPFLDVNWRVKAVKPSEGPIYD